MDGQSTPSSSNANEHVTNKKTYSSALMEKSNGNVDCHNGNETLFTNETSEKDKQMGLATVDFESFPMKKKVEFLIAENCELKVGLSALEKENDKLRKRIAICHRNNANLKQKLNEQTSITEVSQQEVRTQSAICKHMTDIINAI